MPFSEKRFLEQFPDGEYREAVRAFVGELRATGYDLKGPDPPKRDSYGISIRKRIPGRQSRVTVGWIAPPNIKKMRPGATGVTLGTWSCPSHKADSAILKSITENLEKQLAAHTSDLGTYETMAKDATGVRLTPQIFLEKRQDVITLLRCVAAMIDRLAGGNTPS